MSPKKEEIDSEPEAEEEEDMDDMEFEEILKNYKPRSFSTLEQGAQAFLAVLLSTIPVYLYNTVYEVDIIENATIFVPVVLISIVSLFMSYKYVATGTNAVLSNARKLAGESGKHKALGYTKDELDHVQEQMTARESLAWAFVLTNLMYAATFFFFAFYALKEIGFFYSYPISTLIATVISYNVSSAMRIK